MHCCVGLMVVCAASAAAFQAAPMIVTVPIDSSIANANDDAAGSSVTSPRNLRVHAAQRHARLIAKTDH